MLSHQFTTNHRLNANTTEYKEEKLQAINWQKLSDSRNAFVGDHFARKLYAYIKEKKRNEDKRESIESIDTLRTYIDINTYILHETNFWLLNSYNWNIYTKTLRSKWANIDA